MDDIAAIQEVATKAKLNIRCWPAKKEDRHATEATNHQYGAMAEAGVYRKNMVSRKHLKPITDVESEARRYHKDNTLPWGQDGERILPATLIEEYTARMRDFHQKFDFSVAEFKQKYPSIVIDEQQTLGGMYNQAEYPTLRELDDKFGFKVSMPPIESADDFRIKLSETMMNRIREDIRLEERNNQLEMTTDLYKRFHSVIEDMVVRLTATKRDPKTNEIIPKKFSHTAITNIMDLANILPKLNINNDHGLSELRQAVIDKLTDITPEDIRESDAVREVTIGVGKNLLADIESKMSFYTGKIDQKEAA